LQGLANCQRTTRHIDQAAFPIGIGGLANAFVCGTVHALFFQTSSVSIQHTRCGRGATVGSNSHVVNAATCMQG